MKQQIRNALGAALIFLPGIASAQNQIGTENILLITKQGSEPVQIKIESLRQHLDPGDQVSIIGKSGLITDIEIEWIELPHAKAYRVEIAGRYASRISGKKGTLDVRHEDPDVLLHQDGDRIYGFFGNYGEIEGRLEGEVINFSWYSSWTIGRGQWQLGSNAIEIQGNWYATHYDGKGDWNLSRISPLRSNAGPRFARLIGVTTADWSPIEIDLRDVQQIRLQQNRSKAVQSRQLQDGNCGVHSPANVTIEMALDAWYDSDYSADAYELIQRARETLGAPQCDSEAALLLAEQAIDLLNIKSDDLGKGVSAEIETYTGFEFPLEKVSFSTSTVGFFAEWDILTRMNFDDGVFAGSYLSLTGINIGYRFDSPIAIGYQTNFNFLLDPNLDEGEERINDGELELSADLLYARYHWSINEQMNVYALVGYSKVEIKQEDIYFSCFFFCGTTTVTNYSNSESGIGWGLGLQWQVSPRNLLSLKYIDYGDSSIAFEGFHLGYTWAN